MSSSLQLLDHFAFCVDGTPTRMPLALQRVIAHVGLRGVSHRSHLAGTLWPDADEALALARLRTAVWRLRKMRPGCLRCEGDYLGLATSVIVDTQEQERFATSVLHGDLRDPDRVLAGLHHLRLRTVLPGWYDDWVLAERDRMSQLRLHALEHAARLLMECHQLDVALELALEVVCSEPLRETAQATLISVYVAEGNVVDAIHQYDAYRHLLRDELGLEPSMRLETLVRHAGR